MISLVAAVAQNNCIGKNGDLPWDIPADMKRMRALTLGKVLIMGRKTWESIPLHRRPLPMRTNVVISRNNAYKVPDGVEVYSSINAAIAAHPNEEIVGFGGTKIFADMIDMADTLEITHVHQTVDSCDAFFPRIDPAVWAETWREDHDGFAFVTYKKIKANHKSEK
jgi:dihydrofolate reductase